MRSSDILEQIDAAVADWATGPDAMRSNPSGTPRATGAPTPSSHGPRAEAREVLIRRLVDHHGLIRMTARSAVLAVERGQPSRYEHLVRTEANAVIADVSIRIRVSLQPFAEAMAQAFRRIAEAINAMRQDQYELAPPPPRRRERPAWQSPYGPPRSRR
jgi:hypothetical protein